MSEFAAYAPRSAEGSVRHEVDGLVVREAVAADLEAIAAIAAAREGEPVETWRDRLARSLAESAEPDRSILLVAEAPPPSGVVGYGKAALLSMSANAPANAPPHGWYLTGVVVRPEFRRRGIASALTRARLERIAAMGREIHYVASAGNPATIDLHRAFGFVEVTRDVRLPDVSFTGGVGILFRCEPTMRRP